MRDMLINVMIFAGSALMAWNICQYVRFSRRIRENGDWDQEIRILNIPIILLVLFFVGYLVVGIFGHPDLVMAGILFGGSIFVLVMVILTRRIADRIHENEHLKAQVEAAEQASKAKTFFLSNMSHDIRTPLNAIIGYTSLASGEGVTPEEQSDYIKKIDIAGRQLLDIVNDVLEMSRIESGKMVLEPVVTNLEDCIREAGDLVATQLSVRKIHFTRNCQVEHAIVMCDKNLLNRALMNLLCNAGKFTPEDGSVSLELKETGWDENQGHYTISVKDTGIGMSPEFVKYLFHPFEREQTTTVSRTQGTGLGMAITKSIIDMMQGSIEVATQKDEGTEFTIHLSLPIAEKIEQEFESRDEIRFDGIRVLLAEDNPVNTEIALLILGQMGFEVDTVENGREAVDKLTASDPGDYGLVFMDIQMPVMDGYDAARQIRSLDRYDLAHIPIIAMTANAFKDDVNQAKEAGMNGHIAKPLDAADMMETIRSVLMQTDR